LTQNLGRTIVGKAEAIRLMLVALLAGHASRRCPWRWQNPAAKSLLAQLTDDFNACNAPDLLPTDITGTNIWSPKSGEFEYLQVQYLPTSC